VADGQSHLVLLGAAAGFVGDDPAAVTLLPCGPWRSSTICAARLRFECAHSPRPRGAERGGAHVVDGSESVSRAGQTGQTGQARQAGQTLLLSSGDLEQGMVLADGRVGPGHLLRSETTHAPVIHLPILNLSSSVS
jgi:hypothetical protein